MAAVLTASTAPTPTSSATPTPPSFDAIVQSLPSTSSSPSTASFPSQFSSYPRLPSKATCSLPSPHSESFNALLATDLCSPIDDKNENNALPYKLVGDTSSTTAQQVNISTLPSSSSTSDAFRNQHRQQLDQGASISATTSSPPPTFAQSLLLPHLADAAAAAATVIHSLVDSSISCTPRASSSSSSNSSSLLLSHTDHESVVLAAVSAQLQQHHQHTQTRNDNTLHPSSPSSSSSSPSMRSISLSQASARSNIAASMMSMYPSVSSSMMPPADRVDVVNEDLDIDGNSGASEDEQSTMAALGNMADGKTIRLLENTLRDNDDDTAASYDKENMPDSRSGHATPTSSKALSRCSSTASGFHSPQHHYHQQNNNTTSSSSLSSTTATSDAVDRQRRRRSSAAHPRSPSPVQRVVSTGRRSRPNSTSSEAHLAKQEQQQQQSEGRHQQSLAEQLQAAGKAKATLASSPSATTSLSTPSSSSSRLSNFGQGLAANTGNTSRHHRRASRQLFYQIDDSAIVDTPEDAVFAATTALSSSDDQDGDNEAPHKLQRRSEAFSSSSSLSRQQQQQQRSRAAASTAAAAVPSTPTSKSNSYTTAGNTTPHAHHELKDRRSRRGSGSSTRHRSAAGAVRNSQSNASTPRSRRTSMKQRDSELNLAQLHHSLVTANSSLSIKSDDTLSPPSSTNARMDDDTGMDIFANSSAAMSPPLSARSSSHAFPTGVSLVIAVIKIKDFAFLPHDPRFVGDAAPPTPISIPESESAYNMWVSPNALNGQDAVGPYGQQQDGAVCDPSPSLSLLSSSSSSSLSSGFTPPPLGAFGYGHHYNYSGQQGQPGNIQRHQQSGPLQLPPGGSWSTWGPTPESPAGEQQLFSGGGGGIGASSGPPSTSNLSWNFVTDHGPSPFTDLPTTSSLGGGVPNNLLGSALHIQGFDEDFDEDDDEDFTDRVAYNDNNSASVPSLTGDANQASFANLPAGGLLYRVLYSFTAEAPQEMDVAEGDVVRVWQQLDDGWVVGAKLRRHSTYGSHMRSDEEVASGLVPQSYLVLSQDLPASSQAPGSDSQQDKTIPASPSMLQES